MNIVAAISETEINNSCICILRGITESMNLHDHYTKISRKVAVQNLSLREETQLRSPLVSHISNHQGNLIIPAYFRYTHPLKKDFHLHCSWSIHHFGIPQFQRNVTESSICAIETWLEHIVLAAPSGQSKMASWTAW